MAGSWPPARPAPGPLPSWRHHLMASTEQRQPIPQPSTPPSTCLPPLSPPTLPLPPLPVHRQSAAFPLHPPLLYHLTVAIPSHDHAQGGAISPWHSQPTTCGPTTTCHGPSYGSTLLSLLLQLLLRLNSVGRAFCPQPALSNDLFYGVGASYL